MASEKILEQKKARVEEIKEVLNGAASIVVVDYKGISVADDTKLRAELREAGVQYFVLKNSILRFAFKDCGLDELLPTLTGTTAIAVSKDDPIAPSKVMQKYSDQLKKVFNIKAGMVDGSYADAEQIKAIAMLPSRDGLIAQIAGSLNSIIASLARGLSEVAKQKEAA